MSFPLISASTTTGYQIPTSLRLKSSTGSFISYTPTISGNQTTWTWSGWVKRGTIGVNNNIISAGLISGTYRYTRLYFDNSDNLVFYHYPDAASIQVTTSAKFRDPSAWYHIVLAVDTTQPSDINGVRIWVNGVSQSLVFASYTQNANTYINTSTYSSWIGKFVTGGANDYFDGYISEVNFIDGRQELTPASFGQFDSDGNWKAKTYSGAYGMNGFYMPFTDTTTTTALVQSKSKPPAKSNMSVVGDTKWSTAQTKFSDKSIYFDGTGDYLAHPNSASLATGASNCTIEGWVFPITLTGASKIFLVGQSDYASAAGSSFITYLGGSSNSDLYYGSSVISVASPNPIVGQWNHVAWVREGTNWTSYLNGSRVATASGIGSNSVNAGSNAYAAGIGGATNNNGIYNFNGYISELQMVTGVAKYSGATYTIPNSELINNNSDWPNILLGIYGSYGSMASQTTIPYTFAQKFSPSGISLSNDHTYDSMKDVPLGIGAGELGNYATFNSLIRTTNNSGSLTYSDGNLAVNIGSYANTAVGTIGVSSGKWYWEITPLSTTNTPSFYIGVAAQGFNNGLQPDYDPLQWVYYGQTALKVNNSQTAYGETFSVGDNIGVALDMDAGTLTFYKNGISQGQAFSGITGIIFPICSYGNFQSVLYVGNFGQRPFKYSIPTGFKPLHTGNLPNPTIVKPNKHFDVVTYTGNGTSQSISGAQFQPDLVWNKDRSAANSHMVFDSVRGVLKALVTNATFAEQDLAGTLTSFNSNGFSIGNYANDNTLNNAYVSWLWKAGELPVTNNSGSITTQVSANTSTGFSIVTWTGVPTNSSPSTFGHGLGVAPKFIILKNRDLSDDWYCYHDSLGNTSRISLNTTSAKVTSYLGFNSTPPSASVFTVANNALVTNSSQKVLAYCFAEIPGFSKFGSYTGTGNIDGPFVYCGFKPRFVMFKRTDATSDWMIIDSARSQYNVAKESVYANLAIAEESSSNIIDLVSNGFKIRNNFNNVNIASGTYIFAAFAEQPFKYGLAR